jgi:Fe-S oxidoreductase/nitrate reductase gamma subunit
VTTEFLPAENTYWLFRLLFVAAWILFLRRAYHLYRVTGLGGVANRLSDLPARLCNLARHIFTNQCARGEPRIWLAHFLIFWGFCSFALYSTNSFVEGLFPGVQMFYMEWPAITAVVDLFAGFVTIGCLMAAYRRWVEKPEHLENTIDAVICLGMIVALMGTYFLSEGVRYAMIQHPTWAPLAWLSSLPFTGIQTATGMAIFDFSWWIHVLILLSFLVYIPYSKHLHLLAGPFTVAFDNLGPRGRLAPPQEERSIPGSSSPAPAVPAGGAPPAPPAPDSPAAAPQVADGAEAVAMAALSAGVQMMPFSWKQVLDGYACAECGRCDRQCPAVRSGLPLAPRVLVHHFKEFLLKEGMEHFATGGRGNGQRKLLGELITDKVLWSCMTCMACVETCPVRIEHVPLIVEMRRKLIGDGTVDARLQTTLANFQRYGNSYGQSERNRAKWVSKLDFKPKDVRKEEAKVLWFVGDYASYDSGLQEVTATMARVLKRADVDFGLMYEGEKNAGNDVRRIGEEGLYELLVEKNKKSLAKATFAEILTTDPHTFNTLKNEYTWEDREPPKVWHSSEYLEQLLASGVLKVTRPLSGKTVTFHDPCYLGRYNQIYDAPRNVLQALGARLVEMPRHKDRSYCCGAGGGRIWAEETPQTERPADGRIREAAALEGVDTFVVCCPKDIAMFRDAVKSTGNEGKLCVKELAELVEEATS